MLHEVCYTSSLFDRFTIQTDINVNKTPFRRSQILLLHYCRPEEEKLPVYPVKYHQVIILLLIQTQG